ncbi:MAG: NAD(P)H-hydrate dehydratase, partial [Pseudomonadota bacterium]
AADLIVDALFGSGLTRPLPPEVAGPIQGLTSGAGPAPVLAIDMPSGLCADSGRPLGAAVRADLCVTFHAPKMGHHLLPGPDHVGELRRAEIGLGPLRPRAAQGPRARLMREAPAGIDKGAGAGWAHKYDHGHALVLAGGPGRGGAGRLAARAALRVGAGLVTLGPSPAALQENAARLDAVMLRPIADWEALGEALQDRRINAVALGMGLGPGEGTRSLTLAALAARRATVLDADALTSFEEDPDALFAALHERCVLTPHAGEFARLFPDVAERWAAPAVAGPAFSKVDAAMEAATRAGCAVLLKGPDTVVAHPMRGTDVLSPRQLGRAPWLATAGAGDVLAGMIAGLAARGLATFDAASAAVWLHVRAAKAFGPGLIAEDLPDMLPELFDELGF